MKMTLKFFLCILGLSCFSLTACSNNNESMLPATQKRVNETRTFEAPNQDILLKTIITTLQDQGFNIVKVNLDSSEVTAQQNSNIILSVMTYPIDRNKFAVRVNGQIYNNFSASSTGYENIADPVFYQKNFFEPLSRSLFLQNHPF